jgi:uncharacterized protein (DUF736 family)
MIIGTFSYEAGKDTYTGTITTLTVERTNVTISPTKKAGEKGPKYRVIQQGDGGSIEFGAAWKRSSGSGRDFLSVLLDDPALPAALSAALFPGEQDNIATLVWSRAPNRPKAAQQEPASKSKRSRSREKRHEP